MKGLFKCLTPFAPDQSGAVSVLYGLGGMIVILDAGGCTGNICGFDEPRWFEKKSAIFSAGLRDMDAIMGRDDLLIKKIADAAQHIDAAFIALIGTPVPAVTGTDYAALKKILKKRTGLPVLAIDTNGTELYDRGEEKALLEVYGEFSKEKLPIQADRINTIGVTPLSCGKASPEVTLDDIKTASAAKLNIAASPAAAKTAKLLKERFGTPYEIICPAAEAAALDADYTGKSVLIVHQHVFADTLRKSVLARGAREVRIACWFMQVPELMQPGDVSLKGEDDFEALAGSGEFDTIIADSDLKPLAKGFSGTWTDAPHFALSGRYADE